MSYIAQYLNATIQSKSHNKSELVAEQSSHTLAITFNVAVYYTFGGGELVAISGEVNSRLW